MWILWFIILTETLNEETCGIITCMILHAKYVICLLCPKTNKNKRFLATFELSKGFAFLQMHRMWMWILCFIILREKMNEETYHMIVQSNSTIHFLSNPEFPINLTSLETVHVNLVLYHFDRKTKWIDMWSDYMYEFACKVCD